MTYDIQSETNEFKAVISNDNDDNGIFISKTEIKRRDNDEIIYYFETKDNNSHSNSSDKALNESEKIVKVFEQMSKFTTEEKLYFIEFMKKDEELVIYEEHSRESYSNKYFDPFKILQNGRTVMISFNKKDLR